MEPAAGTDLHDIVSLWRTVKMLSPLLLIILGGLGSLMVYYLRNISSSMQNFHVTLAKLLQHIEQHQEQIDEHAVRIRDLEKRR
jgi:hypothetical protein